MINSKYLKNGSRSERSWVQTDELVSVFFLNNGGAL
jgi:hypothetical protein